ncbi:hypothetical protein, partial [Gemmiger formicilis]|uniref:hypothetical protein n=1 Tax=Gemmiger formicilis TaxID=745368 RepID=UPI003C6D0440
IVTAAGLGRAIPGPPSSIWRELAGVCGAGHARPLQANSDYNVAAIYFQTYYIFCEQTLHNM